MVEKKATTKTAAKKDVYKRQVLDGIEKITGIRPAFEQVDLRDKAATEAVFQKYRY